MTANAIAAACVTALPAIDVSVALTNQSSTVLLSANPLFVFNVSSHGTLPVNGVIADFNLPSNLTINSVSAPAGMCTINASNINCDFGDLPGPTVNTVTVDTTAATVGAGMIDATVTTTDVDERPVNNQYSQPLIVDPAVDLVVNSPSTVTVTLDQSATIRATLENRPVMDATAVVLDVSFGSGVRVDSASWTAGTCPIVNAQQIQCVAANFASGATSTLTIGVTGLSAGAQSYTATLSSFEPDADPTNNNVTGSVRVNDPARESSGGAFGLPFLWLLGLIGMLKRRRTTPAQY
jgi:hypothetical protein